MIDKFGPKTETENTEAEVMPIKQGVGRSDDPVVQGLMNEAIRQIETGLAPRILERVIKTSPTGILLASALKSTDGRPVSQIVTYERVSDEGTPVIETQWGGGMTAINTEKEVMLQNEQPLKYPGTHPRFPGQIMVGSYDDKGIFTPDPENKNGEPLMNRWVSTTEQVLDTYKTTANSQLQSAPKLEPVYAIQIPEGSKLIGRSLLTREGSRLTFEAGGRILFNVKKTNGKEEVTSSQYISPGQFDSTYRNLADYLAEQSKENAKK